MYLPDENAHRERRPDDVAESVFFARRQHALFDAAPQRAVLRLIADRNRPTARARQSSPPTRSDRRSTPKRPNRESCRCARDRPSSGTSLRAASCRRSDDIDTDRRTRRPDARSDASICERRCLRERPRSLAPSAIGKYALVASTSSSRLRSLRIGPERRFGCAARVHVGGVDKVDAFFPRAQNAFASDIAVDGVAVGQPRAEADDGEFETGVSERSKLHERYSGAKTRKAFGRISNRAGVQPAGSPSAVMRCRRLVTTSNATDR